MKKALLFCFGLLLLAAAQLQAAPANVNFTSERGTPFNLRFDGRALTRGGARQVHIDRIVPGVHWVDFAIPVGYGRSINYRTRVFLDSGLETSYVLLTRPGFAPELRKVAAVPLRGYGPPPRGGQGGYPNSNDDYYYEDGDVHRNQPTEPGDDTDSRGNYPGGGNNGGNYPNSNSYPNGGYNNGNAYPGSGVSYNRVLSAQDVDGLVAAMHRQSFDKDRMPMAQQALSESAIRAEDLTRLMKELSFESAKMDLAKYGAARVADRQNLYRLNDGFTFSASAREFQEYLAQQR
ncbi:DUF4476 domain-containing protein [Hymenobacter sp. BT186]|uniref:DUF4476 domain-containing protein n=1 Tax=Hymenobacter telluris TaxID=2816474 RepID=A0A939EZH2_9BACT|nr:DUF4476 domain-containing protein [Hymenobacter telluris]MBO0359467.1 DUF4476 domain-containing protein [Hymenobacter telluris]MBW3375493.1 DUF4476 domain-containing protein [Hymenobacter norwichensis]